jgi:hypothetical protein
LSAAGQAVVEDEGGKAIDETIEEEMVNTIHIADGRLRMMRCSGHGDLRCEKWQKKAEDEK